MADGIDIAVDEIKSGLIELKQRLSQYRKKGIDTKIVELRIASIPSKIKMIEITRDISDVKKANQMLYLAKSDAEELERQLQEVLAYKKPSPPDPTIIEINYDIDMGRIAKQKGDINAAKRYYLKAYKSYNTMDSEGKRKVFAALSGLRTLLTET